MNEYGDCNPLQSHLKSLVQILQFRFRQRRQIAPPLRIREVWFMPYLFEFEPVRSILRCTVSGHVPDKELLECHGQAVQYVQTTDPATAIVDLAPVKTINVSP